MTKRTLVLVVDDDADQLQTLCRGLLYLGHACLPARTADEALAALAAPAGDRVDVLLVDMSAPGKPGARLLVEARESRPALKLLVVTGLARSREVSALAARGIPLLRKPFSPEQLGRAIQTALDAENDSKGDKT